jgi:hypothetical protein
LPKIIRFDLFGFGINHFSFAALRLIARPAPGDAEFSDSALPLPLTTNPGVAIEPGMIAASNSWTVAADVRRL